MLPAAAAAAAAAAARRQQQRQQQQVRWLSALGRMMAFADSQGSSSWSGGREAPVFPTAIPAARRHAARRGSQNSWTDHTLTDAWQPDQISKEFTHYKFIDSSDVTKDKHAPAALSRGWLFSPTTPIVTQAPSRLPDRCRDRTCSSHQGAAAAAAIRGWRRQQQPSGGGGSSSHQGAAAAAAIRGRRQQQPSGGGGSRTRLLPPPTPPRHPPAPTCPILITDPSASLALSWVWETTG